MRRAYDRSRGWLALPLLLLAAAAGRVQSARNAKLLLPGEGPTFDAACVVPLAIESGSAVTWWHWEDPGFGSTKVEMPLSGYIRVAIPGDRCFSDAKDPAAVAALSRAFLCGIKGEQPLSLGDGSYSKAHIGLELLPTQLAGWKGILLSDPAAGPQGVPIPAFTLTAGTVGGEDATKALALHPGDAFALPGAACELLLEAESTPPELKLVCRSISVVREYSIQRDGGIATGELHVEGRVAAAGALAAGEVVTRSRLVVLDRPPL